MESLANFLNTFRVERGSPANLGSLKGGLFNIPPARAQEFYKLYVSAAKTFTEDSHTAFVFRPPECELQPLFVDLDVKTTDAIPLALKTFVKFAEITAKHLSGLHKGPIRFLVVTKKEGYFDNKQNYGRVFCTGSHIYYPDVRLSLAEAKQVRLATLGCVDQVFGHLSPRNGPDDIVDARIPHRSNGLMMLGDFKRKAAGGRYMIRHVGVFDQGVCSHQPCAPEDFWEHLDMERIYNFVFDHKRMPKAKKIKATKKAAKRTTVVPMGQPNEGGFQLDKYLTALGSYVPDNDVYTKLCMYFANTELDPQYVGDLCNRAWCPGAGKLKETERMVRGYKNKSHVNQGSAIYVLQQHATEVYDLEEIFPPDIYKYHNQARIFQQQKVIWEEREIYRFLTNVYHYCWGGGRTEFVYKEERKKRFGKQYFTTVETVVTKTMPFSKPETDMFVNVKPTLAELLKIIRKLAKRNWNKNTPESERTKITSASALLSNRELTYKEAVDFLGPDAPDMKESTMGFYFIEAKQRGLLEGRWHSYNIEPYIGEDPTPSDQLNIFGGFDLQRFACEGDVTTTVIWEWLWVVWANRNKYKMDWLLCMFATKLQFPARKIQKFVVAYCRQTGCGKTSIRYFLQALFNRSSVLFCDQVDEFLENENSEQLGKLWCVVDDIDRCKRKQSDGLKSRITADTFRYKRLYENRVTMNSYLDLIGTSNSPRPVFVGENDRRVELVRINPEKKNDTPENKDFWNQFYAETEDVKIMGAWFQFLSTYEIKLDVRSMDVRFDRTELEAQKITSMKLTHRWAMEFFQDVECFEGACFNPQREPEWFGQIRFRERDGQRTVFIAKQRAYDYFHHWKRKVGKKTDVNRMTFEADLLELGLCVQRKTINKHKLRGYVFDSGEVKGGLCKFYKLSPESISLAWAFEDAYEFKEYSQHTWRFKDSGSGFI